MGFQAEGAVESQGGSWGIACVVSSLEEPQVWGWTCQGSFVSLCNRDEEGVRGSA